MPTTPAIVVVEDDVSMSQAIERLLSAAGWRAAMFSSAEDLLASEAVDDAVCFVFDIQLPGLSGFGLYDRLSTMGVRVPVIFITAYDSPIVKQQAERIGAIGYFAKPFAGREPIGALAKNFASP
jgi:FixJ family two-component response regulator